MALFGKLLSKLFGTGERPAAHAIGATPSHQSQAPSPAQSAVYDVTYLGVRRTDRGVHLICRDGAGREVLTDPVTRLTPTETGLFLAFTQSGACLRLRLTSPQEAELKTALTGAAIPQPAAPRPPTSGPVITARGFSRSQRGIHFRFRDAEQRDLVSSPVLRLNPLGNSWHDVHTTSGSVYRAQLTEALLTEFQNLTRPPSSTQFDPFRAAPGAPAPVTVPQATRPETIPPRPARQTETAPRQPQTSPGRVASSPPKPQQVRQQTPVWHGFNTPVDIAGRRIRDPLTFIAASCTGRAEASCIYTNLEVAKPGSRTSVPLNYWPTYKDISPIQRSVYLDWLAADRQPLLADIGYVFIFFYGLERRILVDKKIDDEVLTELQRLIVQYKDSHSFLHYSSSLLAFALARRGIESASPSQLDDLQSPYRYGDSEIVRPIRLAWYFLQNRPLSPDEAQKVVSEHYQAQKSVVVERLPKQLRSLFAEKYRARYGDGLVLRASKRDHRIQYQPGSSSISLSSVRDGLSWVSIPNVLGIPSQFEPLVKIWNDCVEELRPLSRQVGKGVSVDSRAAYDLLPDPPKRGTVHPDSQHWEIVASHHARPSGVSVVPIAELATLIDIKTNGKLTLRQSQEIARVARDVGFAIEPDSGRTGRAYSFDEYAAIYCATDQRSATEIGFVAASAVLECGFAMAMTDGTISSEEAAHVTQFIEQSFELDACAARRLDALRCLYLEHPPSVSKVGGRLAASLNDEQRIALAHLLMSMAAVNGQVERSEVSGFKKLLRAIGIANEQADGFVKQLTTLVDVPVEVYRAKPEAFGEALPRKGADAPAIQVFLNQDRLREILNETAHVAHLLTEAMSEEGDEPAAEPELTEAKDAEEVVAKAPLEDARFPGLDLRYHAIAAHLLQKAEWSKTEYDAAVRGFALFPSSTLEVLNEWADEQFGDVLIEDADVLIVQRELVV